MDFIFLFSLFLIWKPISYFLLYIELILKAILKGSKAMIFSKFFCLMLMAIIVLANIIIFTISQMSHSSNIYLDTYFMEFFVFSTSFYFIVSVYMIGIDNILTQQARQDWNDCIQCLKSITSVSLLLRSLPFIGISILLVFKYVIEFI